MSVPVFNNPRTASRIEDEIGRAMLNFEERNGHQVCLPKKPAPSIPRVKSEDMVIEFVGENPGCTRSEISDATKLHAVTVSNLLSQAIRQNRVKTLRDMKIGNGLYSRYWIADKAAEDQA